MPPHPAPRVNVEYLRPCSPMSNLGPVGAHKYAKMQLFSTVNGLCRHLHLRELGIRLREAQPEPPKSRLRYSISHSDPLSGPQRPHKLHRPALHSALSYKLRAERQAIHRRPLLALSLNPTSNLSPRYNDSFPLALHVQFRAPVPLLALGQLG